ncbi:caffeoylshikimate esterase isoform X2 [Cryptomeria japonica]|uniref:caffeoylshikimate esterase isoform X2 n=1 Tax=Cryptomeria japonica TaxID=3369 RepID=UPI0025ABDD70|nr:caffeoylshikimate esterase isoform X2 [Cryptomeria japonica]
MQMTPSGVKTNESYETNSRGLEIFSKSWLPESIPVKGIVCFCHGYGDTCTFFFEGIAKKIAASGYGVFSMDYPGFGLSEGLHGYIPNFDELVDDVIEHFSKVKAQSDFKDVPCFLFGQSMGGAVALKVHLKQPREWDGTILVAPMCKIAEDVTPPKPVLQVLGLLSRILPKQKLFPQKDISELAFRELKKRNMAVYNVIAYKDQMRLMTAMELLKTTAEIETQLEKVSSPLLILHGDADQVTDPSVSKSLYEKSNSLDKTLKLYREGYHCILEGEPDERIYEVFDDMISWLEAHCRSRVLNTSL